MVRMYHDDPSMTGGPTTADVPEEAISWMQRCGWYLRTEEVESKPIEKTELKTRKYTRSGLAVLDK